MDWFAKIDANCERTHEGFWAEPLNAWTNAAFLFSAAAAAWVVWRIVGRRWAWRDVDLWLLPFWLVCIAVGSFLFHTWANRLSGALDVGSIMAFVLTYLAVFTGRVLRWRGVWTAAWLVVLLGMSVVLPGVAFALLPELSEQIGRIVGYVCAYAPTTVSVFLAGLLAQRAGRRRGARLLYAAGGVFIVSMTVTGLDGPLCDQWPWGTHFAWHLLNAAVLTLAMLGLGGALGADDASRSVAGDPSAGRGGG